MTQDEIKELIKECRNPVGYIGNWGRVQWADNVYPQLGDDLYAGVDLETFAKLVAAKEQNRCCSIIYGQCGSDNVAERTVQAIRGKK